MLPTCAALASANAAHAKPDTVATATCRIVESAAHASRLPVGLLTRLVWVERRFRAGVVSPAGAQGIAQFMPQTAAERRLADPFDPEQAIPAAARLLIDLERRFGNIGLAAAAYNAGSDRVAKWLRGTAVLPRETRAYVFAVTGRSAEDWAASGREGAGAETADDSGNCIEVTAALRTGEGAAAIPIAPWGIQLAGNFSKAIALASFLRAQQYYANIIGGLRPMIIGTRLLSRGTLPFYRALVPAATRAQAARVCQAIEATGGACVVVPT